MRVLEKTKEAIESRAAKMSDFLKMEYFESVIRQHKDASFEIRKYANVQLTDLYEKRSMYLEAAKNMNALADIAATFNDKRLAFIRVIELCVKAGAYDRADDAFKKAMACANLIEKEEIKSQMKIWYQQLAQLYEKNQKSGNALKAYEKLYTLNATDGERQAVKQKLLLLYNKLGKIREFNTLRSS